MIADRALGTQELAIARSVLYAALFDYPLTLAQLRQTLIESEQTASQILSAYERSEALRAIVDRRGTLFFPRGKDHLVVERTSREERSRAFLRRHRLLLACICAMPYVRMVALSGSIAHLNLDRDGDLDLFIVTRGRRAWLVTVAVIVLSKLLGSRRALCANYTVTDERLAFEQQDLFAASQFIHLRPLIGREMYRELLAANPFVHRYYPNFHDAAAGSLAVRQGAALIRTKRAVETVLRGPSRVADAICRVAYRWHLTRHASSWQSPEQVRLDADCLKLHTRSHRRAVLARFERTVDAAIRDVEAAEPWVALRR